MSDYHYSPWASPKTIRQIDTELGMTPWEGEIPKDLQLVPERAWENERGRGCTADFESHVIHRGRRYRVIVWVFKNDTEIRARIYRVLCEEDPPASAG